MGADPARAALTTCPGCGRRNRVPVAARGRVRCPACHADLPWLVDAGDVDFDQAVLTARLPVLVDVWAPWCGPCRTMAPVVQQLARDRAGQLKVVEVNADEAPGVSARLGVRGIPALVLFADGRERGRVVGAQTLATLTRWLEEQLTG